MWFIDNYCSFIPLYNDYYWLLYVLAQLTNRSAVHKLTFMLIFHLSHKMTGWWIFPNPLWTYLGKMWATRFKKTLKKAGEEDCLLRQILFISLYYFCSNYNSWFRLFCFHRFRFCTGLLSSSRKVFTLWWPFTYSCIWVLSW